MEISLEHYKGSNIEKGFRETPSLEQLDLFTINKIEKSLVDNFNQGKFSKEIFERELQKIDIVKAGKLSQNGKLRPVHIIDKNGKHTVVWKAPEDIAGLHNEGHKKVRQVERGDTVTYNGETHTVHSISDKHGYWTLVGPDGKKHDKSPARFESIHAPKEDDKPKVEEPKEKGKLEIIQENLNNVPKGTTVSGGGYSFTKKGKNHWETSSGTIKNDETVASMLGSFSDFKVEESKVEEPKVEEKQIEIKLKNNTGIETSEITGIVGEYERIDPYNSDYGRGWRKSDGSNRITEGVFMTSNTDFNVKKNYNIRFKNTDYWNTRHYATISAIERNPRSHASFAGAGATPSETIQSYRQLIQKNNSELERLKSGLEKTKQIASDIKNQLPKLSKGELFVATDDGGRVFVSDDKSKLESSTYSTGGNSDRRAKLKVFDATSPSLVKHELALPMIKGLESFLKHRPDR